MQINLTIKDRILQFLKYKGISQYRCYTDTGITRGLFAQEFRLSEDNLLKFLNFYTEVDPTWLVTGKGKMLVDNNANEQINLTNSDAESHLEEVRGLQKGSYTDTFVEQLLVDHSKLTDSHQKLTDAHYLLAANITQKNREMLKPKEYDQNESPLSQAAEKGVEYKKEEK